MKFVSDPPISVKVDKMKQRVRWREPSIIKRSIDQTRLVIDDGISDTPDFSFLVIGDTGSGAHLNHHPQRKIAELMLAHRGDSRFLIHTGDVVYQVGSSEYYPENFIYPYREFLVDSEKTGDISYDQMIFNLPFLPVLGNHDYYDLPLVYGFLAQASWPIRHIFRKKLDLGIGWHGSNKGQAYAKAFLDYLKAYNDGDLETHLDRHYTAKTNTGFCLRYEPGRFTRLPNRYYTFHYGGIDFFALDSNTFNAPEAIPRTEEGQILRQKLIARHAELEQFKQEILFAIAQLNSEKPEEAEMLDDKQAKLDQVEEQQLDIQKQLTASEKHVIDYDQLEWLKNRLIESWNTEEVRGRVLFFHHPPYVTEKSKWYQGQTLEVRYRLRQVLDAVAEKIGDLAKGRPLVDLVLCGHAHCLEHLTTNDTGHADSNINWIVCGGSGHSLRRQRKEGAVLEETFEEEGGEIRQVAHSHLFIGRTGRGSQKRRPYSCLRIDVQSGNPPKFVLRPFVAERYKGEWIEREIEPFVI